MLRLLFLVSIFVGLTACSNDGGNAGSGGTLIPENVLNKRIKIKSIDLDQDGSVDIETTYSYDSMNRIASRAVEYVTDLSTDYTITYEYQDGLLVSKTSTDRLADTHTYEGDLLVSSFRVVDDDTHTYTYNDQRQLIASTGEDYLFNDDCENILPTRASFTLDYSAGRVTSIKKTDGSYTFSLSYNGGQLSSFEERYNCGDSLNSDEEVYTSTLVYGGGRVTKLQQEYGFGLEEVAISYGSNDRVSKIVETDSDETATTVLSYSDEGLLLQQEFNTDSQSTFFRRRNYTQIFGYEEGTCIVSLSSNPAKLAIVESLIAIAKVDPYLNCGYHLDEGEL